jgi:hypothetical protein
MIGSEQRNPWIHGPSARRVFVTRYAASILPVRDAPCRRGGGAATRILWVHHIDRQSGIDF